jgi:hypothetical protein
LEAELNKNSNENNFFETMLLENKLNLSTTRTANELRKRYDLFKKLHLLEDQVKEHFQQSDGLCSISQLKFEQVEQMLDDKEIRDKVNLNDTLEKEMTECYETLEEHIKRAEVDLFLWQILIDKVTGLEENPFGEIDTLAALVHENFLYKMKKRQVIIS